MSSSSSLPQNAPDVAATTAVRPLPPPPPWHPAVEAQRSDFHRDVIDEVSSAVARDAWVLVGMSRNPFVARARKLLQEEGIQFTELSYGGYGSKWKHRLAIKLWAGFPTFPMVFRKGVLLGGASDLIALQREGKLKD